MMSFSVENLNIVAAFKGSNGNIVTNLNFSVAAGERLAIVGESGCGKTMTAMSIMGLLPKNCAAFGKICLNSTDLTKLTMREIAALRGREIILIPQSGADFLNPVLTIKTQMYESLRLIGIRNKNQLFETSCNLLTSVGLESPAELLKKYPFQLSGGMAQRIILAIGLSSNPSLVIADEPTRGIDDETAFLFIDQLERLFEKSSVILITHNISVAKTCHKVLVMFNGKAVEYGNAEDILNNPQTEYTKQLLNALPENGLVAANDETRRRFFAESHKS